MFKLKPLLQLYQSLPSEFPSSFRHFGGGSAFIVGYFSCQGINDPSTCDLSENIIHNCARLLREGLPVEQAEGFILDAYVFMLFLYEGEWLGIDYSHCLIPNLDMSKIFNEKAYREKWAL